jgi:hypothetical protein
MANSIKMNAVQTRILGSTLLIGGYFVMLYIDMKTGCYTRFIGNLAMLPFSFKVKAYDFVALDLFYAGLDLSKIIQLSS